MLSGSESSVAVFLRELGIQVRKIAETQDPTPDLLASDGTHEYLVEVKAKGPSSEWVAALADEGRASAALPLGATGPLSRVIATAATQLDHEPARERVRVLAFDVDPRWPELAEQIEAALYGSRVAVEPGGEAKRVLYVDPPQFGRYRSIDVALIFLKDGVRALLNDYSTRFALARESRLVKVLAEDDAVFDPRAALTSGEVMMFPAQWRELSIAEKERRFREEHKRFLVRFTSYSETAVVER